MLLLMLWLSQSLRRNPFAPDVPCHRVVAADLELGGFSGSWVSLSEGFGAGGEGCTGWGWGFRAWVSGLSAARYMLLPVCLQTAF